MSSSSFEVSLDLIFWAKVGILFFVAHLVWKGISRAREMLELSTVRIRRQKERDQEFARIGHKYGQINPKAQEILSLSDKELIAGLQSRKLKATEVLEAFIAKAYQIQLKHNCITEFIQEAHTWAQELDGLSQVKGPLHGLPVSIKDNCNVRGHDSTLGLTKELYKPAPDHAVIVQVILDLGGVPFVKTNVPQTLLSFGCSNPIFGETSNVLNSNLSPGGSSGGESSLIAGGGSVFGIGSDIGGSVRIPAHFTGLYGFKPTNFRLSGTGYKPSVPNVVGIAGVPGLLTRDVDTLADVLKLLIDENRQHNYDTLTVPVPWNNEPFLRTRKLRVGYFKSLDYYPLVGDTGKVLENAKNALEQAGHTVVPFEMPDAYKMMDIVAELTFADQGTHIRSNWRGEVIPKYLLLNFFIFHTPMWLRKTLARLIEFPIPLLHSKRGATFLRGAATRSVDLWARMGQRKQIVLDMISQWKKLEIDVLLCPSFPFPAVPLRMAGRMQSAIVYTMIWNLLDFPAGVVKFGTESGSNLDSFDDEDDFMLRTAPMAVREAVGMPISVQLVGLPFQDEEVLNAMEVLDKLRPNNLL